MLLKNFTKSAMRYNTNSTFTPVTLLNGTTQNVGNKTFIINDYNSNMRVYLGGGDTEPNFNDYCLENPINLHSVNNYWETGAELDGNVLYRAVSIYSNDTGASVTIKEVGLVLYFYVANSYKECLLARSVLETPVTIAAGETYTFSYEISL